MDESMVSLGDLIKIKGVAAVGRFTLGGRLG